MDTSGEAFEVFYTRERDAIGRALVVTLRDETLAADALDEALARAYQRWGEVSGYANAGGWVYRVALNSARSSRRRLARPRRPLRPTVFDVDEPWFDADIERAMRSLSVDHRAVVVCRYYIGYSEAETARALGLRVGTVKSRLARALAALRDSAQLGRSIEAEGAR